MRKNFNFNLLTKKIIVLLVTVTTVFNYLFGYTANVDAAKKMSLYIKTTRYIRTNQTGKVKRSQTIRLKNLSSKHKVKWKSSDKKLAYVKAGKNGKAVLKVSLKKAGTATITAIVKTKKSNKKVLSFTKKIKIINKKKKEKLVLTPTAKPNNQSAPTNNPTPKPTGNPTPSPTFGDNLVPLPTNNPTAISTTTPSPAPTPTKNPNDGGWTGWH